VIQEVSSSHPFMHMAFILIVPSHSLDINQTAQTKAVNAQDSSLTTYFWMGVNWPFFLNNIKIYLMKPYIWHFDKVFIDVILVDFFPQFHCQD
jgi:hypothetical protein